MIIVKYTSEEGGEWKLWPLRDATVSLFTMQCINRTGKGSILFPSDDVLLPVHALRFSGGEEWDAINGWRMQRDLEEEEE